MHFHDSAGMINKYYDYWEACGCEAVGEWKPYPRPLDSRHISALLYMSWARASGRGVESPLEKIMEEPGVETDCREYVRMLEKLEGVDYRPVTIRLWSWWERVSVAKWARVEEYMKEQGRLRTEKRRLAGKRKKIYAKRVKAIGKYKTSEELERAAFECEKEALAGTDKMAYMRAAKYWNQADIRRREERMARKKEVTWEVKEDNDVSAKRVENGTKDLAKEEERPEVELEVIRVAPNPRIVICRYKLLADELLVKLNVGNNSKFVRGMRIMMKEQVGEEWEYRGKLPRSKGRW